jgi:predicted DNA-binding protein (UPF0251 family)
MRHWDRREISCSPAIRVFDPAKTARHPEEAIVADAVELQQPMLKSGRQVELS